MPAARTGTILKAWHDGTTAFAAVSVPEDKPTGTVEYIASTPLRDDKDQVKAAPQLKAELAAAVTALRAAQLDARVPAAVAVGGAVNV